MSCYLTKPQNTFISTKDIVYYEDNIDIENNQYLRPDMIEEFDAEYNWIDANNVSGTVNNNLSKIAKPSDWLIGMW